MRENWRPVFGFEGLYEVSSFGRIRSLGRPPVCGKHGGRGFRECILRAHSVSKGHLRVKLRQGQETKFFVHTLVLTAFVGPCPQGMECRHLDGNPANNRLGNLKWGTPEENWADRRRHGNGFVDYCTNTSGMRGVSYDKRSRRWHAYIGFAPRENIGWFAVKADAVKARLKAEARRGQLV
jgi:hypothetical protein